MTTRNKKVGIVLVILAVIAIVAIWAINGYEDTWLYVTAIIIAVPASWFSFGKENDNE